MALCDYAIDRYVRDRFFDRLNSLTPAERAAEKFRLEIEALDFELRETDTLLGWFRFKDNGYSYKHFDDEISDDETQRIIDKPHEFGSIIKVDKAHTVVDYAYILNYGLEAYEKRISNELEREPDSEYLMAMKKSLDCVRLLISRAAVFLEEKYSQAGDAEKMRISEIRRMIKKVPFEPAEDFGEAVQSVWIIHFLIPLAENAWYSISLGRFDSYMYPFYKASLEKGVSRAEIKSIIKNLYELLNSYADGACLMNVGPVYNELSELLIECQKDFSLPSPILGARIDNNTPDYIWNALIDETLFSMGQPTFYGEDACVNALVEKGIPLEKALKFSNNSCMGISMAGEEFNSMWGCVFCTSAALEAAVNGGKLLRGDYTVPNIDKATNIDELFGNFEKTADALFGICVNAYHHRADISERTDPDPFLSVLTANCIETHRDRISGCVYHNVTVECMGMVNVADGICAIDRLVFKEKKYTLDEICEAVKMNFEGYETLRQDNRDFTSIKRLKRWCGDHAKGLFLLANSGCFNDCPARTFHDNLVAHEVEIAKADNGYSFSGICRSYLSSPEKRIALIRDTSYIRPEDIHLYEAFFDTVKLATRVNPNPERLLSAYLDGVYRGAVTDLLEPDNGSALLPVIIDSSRFPTDFANNLASCKKDCETCSYCQAVLDRASVSLE